MNDKTDRRRILASSLMVAAIGAVTPSSEEGVLRDPEVAIAITQSATKEPKASGQGPTPPDDTSPQAP
ncbi:MAG: hypothetical protein QM758_29690 [Armatimonas sp.]